MQTCLWKSIFLSSLPVYDYWKLMLLWFLSVSTVDLSHLPDNSLRYICLCVLSLKNSHALYTSYFSRTRPGSTCLLTRHVCGRQPSQPALTCLHVCGVFLTHWIPCKADRRGQSLPILYKYHIWLVVVLVMMEVAERRSGWQSWAVIRREREMNIMDENYSQGVGIAICFRSVPAAFIFILCLPVLFLFHYQDLYSIGGFILQQDWAPLGVITMKAVWFLRHSVLALCQTGIVKPSRDYTTDGMKVQTLFLLAFQMGTRSGGLVPHCYYWKVEQINLCAPSAGSQSIYYCHVLTPAQMAVLFSFSGLYHQSSCLPACIVLQLCVPWKRVLSSVSCPMPLYHMRMYAFFPVRKEKLFFLMIVVCLWNDSMGCPCLCTFKTDSCMIIPEAYVIFDQLCMWKKKAKWKFRLSISD